VCVLVWTDSSCDTVKLREPPKASSTKLDWKQSNGRVNSPGYGNNDEDGTMGNPQPSPKSGDDRIWMQFID